MRAITCLFFSVATLLLGSIRDGVGGAIDALPALAALFFLVAAAAFVVIDWPSELPLARARRR